MPTEWDRQPGEPGRWYDRFVRYYLRAEGERTLLGAYRQWQDVERPEKARKGQHVPGCWKDRAEEWAWQGRAEEYDVELRRLDGVKWEKRREEIRDRGWNVSGRLWDKANAMLAFPVSEQQVEQDGQTVIIEPARWTFRDAAAVAETADRLARLAAGLPTERTESKIEGEVVTHEGVRQTPWWEVLDEAGLDAAMGRMERADAPPEDTGDDDDDDGSEAGGGEPGQDLGDAATAGPIGDGGE